MAKQRRPARPAVKAGKRAKLGRRTAKATSRVPPRREAAARRSVEPVPPPAPAPPPPKKPSFYEAVAIYERGVQALQRHDYPGAASLFRVVLDRYPQERELLERARLYLRVCERETARQPPAPRTAAERVYAATVAINTGDHGVAIDHLQRALSEDPENDHAHYTMAVALGGRGRVAEGLGYLKNAVALNPENRSLARQDPDLDPLRVHPQFGAALDAAPVRRRARPRR